MTFNDLMLMSIEYAEKADRYLNQSAEPDDYAYAQMESCWQVVRACEREMEARL